MNASITENQATFQQFNAHTSLDIGSGFFFCGTVAARLQSHGRGSLQYLLTFVL